MSEMTLPEIFGGIADRRSQALDGLIVQKLQENIDIRETLKSKIDFLWAEALTRGTKTERFRVVGEEIAFLKKIEQALKGNKDG